MGSRPFTPMFLLLGVIYTGLSSPPVCAQLPLRLEGCLPYPTLADEIREMRGETTKETPKPIAVIDDVRIEGRTHLPLYLRKQLTVSILGKEFRGDKEKWLGELEEVGIRGFLQEQGYFKATSSAKAQLVSDDSVRQHFRVTIQVEEGLRYRLGKVQLEGNKAFSAQELRTLIRMRKGEIFDVSKVRNGLEAIYRKYASKGFVDATPAPLTEIDEARRIALVIRVDEQRQYRVGQFEILGLDPKMEGLLRSILKPGQIYNSKLVYDFFRENKAVLPADVGQEDMRVNRDVPNGLLSGVFDLRTCAQFQAQN